MISGISLDVERPRAPLPGTPTQAAAPQAPPPGSQPRQGRPLVAALVQKGEGVDVSAQREPGLVSRTDFDGAGGVAGLVESERPSSPHFVLKYRRYPSGHAELTAVKVLEPLRALKRAQTDIDEGERAPRQETNIARSVRRARTTVRRKAMTMRADHLFTLTYRQNQTDRDLSFKDFLRFVRLVRDRWPKFQYIAVAERQKRGAWHFHIATNQFYPVQVLNAIWQRVVGANNGNVDVKYRKKISPVKIARYMTKYISKGFNGDERDQNIPGANRYRVSHGIHDPVQTGYLALSLNPQRMVEEIYEQLTGGLPSGAWANQFYIWLCNFDSREEDTC